ncbi:MULTISPECIES: RNA polymerase sigma factor [Sphingobium]|jgi:RNA polymerase sigma factor (sigma-70 family)|uniref:RNA polymerase sigma factor n=1 Tax=Sphingobium TaxID=165695 RepID=UPI000DBBA4A3|nr:RNA polymerase sigma factor [Sphingobium sp. YG1]MBU0930390.1 RNA polymerase sigma factor [Alphaproteobacteria bacterium]BBD02334.1 RNA polymerase sigma-70 factor, ECF subfamily [Sphingobium sp. YG1]|tara:strand:+ start:5719 stop:6231 length:513 start_codon:yes stop_codon:yes gene_type:complete|eukprot:Opistho-1_new@83601
MTNSIALSRLLIAERKSLLRQVRRLVGRDGAEDVAQTLWFKVQAVRDDPPILDKKAYLRRLAHNVAVDHVRDDWRQATVAERSEALLWGVDYELGPERIVESHDMLERIRAAIASLPEPTRSILRLTRLEGRTQRETAEKVGVTTTTVENHLRRALALLARVRDGDLDGV